MREGRALSSINRGQGVEEGFRGGGWADSTFTNQTPMVNLGHHIGSLWRKADREP